MIALLDLPIELSGALTPESHCQGCVSIWGRTACVAVLDFLGCLEPVAADCWIDGLFKDAI
jgi:hypothetical protein